MFGPEAHLEILAFGGRDFSGRRLAVQNLADKKDVETSGTLGHRVSGV